MTGHVSSAFPGAQDHRTRSSTVNKSPSESMSFITEVICKFIFTDVHMRNNYRPNWAYSPIRTVIVSQGDVSDFHHIQGVVGDLIAVRIQDVGVFLSPPP